MTNRSEPKVNAPWVSFSAFELRHSFVIRHFVIRHCRVWLRLDGATCAQRLRGAATIVRHALSGAG
jgi:hypothetical protein